MMLSSRIVRKRLRGVGLVDDYLASCRAKDLSPKTIKLAYGYPLKGRVHTLVRPRRHVAAAPDRTACARLPCCVIDLIV
jgi:hypothetical protein